MEPSGSLGAGAGNQARSEAGYSNISPEIYSKLYGKSAKEYLSKWISPRRSAEIECGKDDPLGPLMIEFANLAIDEYNLQENTSYQFLEIKYATRHLVFGGQRFVLTFQAQTPDNKLQHFRAIVLDKFNEKSIFDVSTFDPDRWRNLCFPNNSATLSAARRSH